MMKKFLLTSMTLFSLLGLWAAAPSSMPTLSTPGNEVWYYIQFVNGSAFLADQGVGFRLFTEAADGVNKQLWKVEETATPGQYLITSKLGNQITWNAGISFFISSASGTAFTFVGTTNTTYTPGWELQRAGQTANSMNQYYGGGIGHYVCEYTINDGGNPLNFVTAKQTLQAIITETNTFLSSVVIGTTPGTYPQAAKDNLTTAITTAQGVYDNASSTESDCFTGVANLRAAVNVFKNAIILPIQTSTALAPKWYYINNVGRPTSGSTYDGVMSFNESALLKLTPINTATRTAAQLFRFESVSGVPGGVRVINALMQGGEMRSTNSQGADIASSVAVPYGTSVNTAWTLPLLTGANGNQYNFKSSTGWNTHADGSMNIVRWNGGYGTASAWTFTPLSANASDEQVTIGYMVVAAQNVYNATTEGSVDGTYSAASRTAFNNAIATAQAFDPTGKTQAQILQAETALSDALTQYFNSQLAGVSPLKSTVASPVWYVFQCNIRNGAVISAKSGGTATIGMTTLSNPTDSIMWRFEYDAATKKYSMINKATGKYLSDFSVLSTATSYTWTPDEFPVGSSIYRFFKGNRPLPSTAQYLHMDASKNMTYWYATTSDGGSQFAAISGITAHKNAFKTTLDSINTVKVNGTYPIGTAVGQYPQSARDQLDAACTSAQGVYDNTSATYDQAASVRTTLRAAWKTFTLSQNTVTGLNGAEKGKILVYASNNMISVKGTIAHPEAFTLTGISIDITKPVKPGVYIVKVLGQTYKVSVQ